MKLLFPAVLLCFFMVACKKDQFETKPKIEIKSVNTKFLTFSGSLVVKLEFRDKEGDLSDSITVIRQRLNERGPVERVDPYDIPSFPNTMQGELGVTFNHTQMTTNITSLNIPGQSGKNENDTMRLSFIARDRGKHLSDTVRLDDIIVNRTP